MKLLCSSCRLQWDIFGYPSIKVNRNYRRSRKPPKYGLTFRLHWHHNPPPPPPNQGKQTSEMTSGARGSKLKLTPDADTIWEPLVVSSLLDLAAQLSLPAPGANEAWNQNASTVTRPVPWWRWWFWWHSNKALHLLDERVLYPQSFAPHSLQSCT